MDFRESLEDGPKSYSTGITPLDDELPEGLPRNAFGVIRGPGGGGKSVILNEMAKSMMHSGRPVIYVCFEDSPLSVLQSLCSLGWDYSNMLEEGMIELVDCFSSQILGKSTKHEHSFTIRDPSESGQITDALRSLIQKIKPERLGGIYVDSITEFFVQSHPFKAINTMKAWRATFCKELQVPLWAIYHTGLQQFSAYDDTITYSSDAILDTRHEPAFQSAGVLIKQFRVTKIRGAPHNSAWVTFTVGSEGIRRMTLEEMKEIARSITKYESPATD
ncbi:hypothetical protein EU538_12820 [Candidatus Thorarchaeota archaeon]|nr:MAG: hypothetical protein EU538_12820 [Candidatus Thorarchaeota archaeon]